MATSCYGCGAALRIDGPVGRRMPCPDCDADLHCCMNCRHYDESAAHQCREPQVDHVVDKEASNPCDLFQLGDGGSRRRHGAKTAARNALGALFGEAPREEQSPRDALDALFKK